MQADGRLVQDVHGPHQGAAQGRYQVHPLAFAAGEGVHGAAEGKIPKTHVLDALQAVADFLDGLPGYAKLVSRERYPVGAGYDVMTGLTGHLLEPGQKLLHRHGEQVMDGFSAYFNVQGLFPQPAAATGVAGGAAGIAAEHVFVLNLIAVGLYPLEELVDAHDGAFVAHGGAGVPQRAFLRIREFAVRLEDGDAVFVGILYYLVLEPAHFFSAPAGDGAVVNAFGLVRDHQVLAHAHDLAQAAAHRAGAQRRVKAEEVFVRLPESEAVALEAGAEPDETPDRVGGDGSVMPGLTGHLPQGHIAASFVEGGLDGGMKPRAEVIVQRAPYLDAVYQKPQAFRVLAVHLHDVLNGVEGTIGRRKQAAEALFLEREHELHPVLAAVPMEVCQNVPCPFREGRQHIFDAMGLHLFPAHGRIGAANAGEQDAQVVVDFRGGGHGGTRVANVHLLLDGNGRWNAFYGIYVRFYHAAQELPGIGGKAFCKAALALCKEGVKGQGTFSAAAHAGNDNQPITGNLHRNVFQVVHPGVFNDDVSFYRHIGTKVLNFLQILRRNVGGGHGDNAFYHHQQAAVPADALDIAFCAPQRAFLYADTVSGGIAGYVVIGIEFQALGAGIYHYAEAGHFFVRDGGHFSFAVLVRAIDVPAHVGTGIAFLQIGIYFQELLFRAMDKEKGVYQRPALINHGPFHHVTGILVLGGLGQPFAGQHVRNAFKEDFLNGKIGVDAPGVQIGLYIEHFVEENLQRIPFHLGCFFHEAKS